MQNIVAAYKIRQNHIYMYGSTVLKTDICNILVNVIKLAVGKCYPCRVVA